MSRFVAVPAGARAGIAAPLQDPADRGNDAGAEGSGQEHRLAG